MSSTVDDRVVAMRIDNSKFASGVNTTLGLLSKLKSSLTFGGGKNGIDAAQASVDHFHTGTMSASIDHVSGKFLAMSAVAISAISNIVNRAVNAGISIGKAFTVDPIAAGFHSYETQINAAKTIMANTGAKLPAVEKQLSQLQTYANQTVYSFQDMAQNIGTFTAAGVKLVPATSAIKGMGNSAALSGASVQQLNGAMYQMSQAMSSGTIRLQDWNSLSNANMGGQNIQKALMATASTIKGTGPKMDAAIKKYGNFRNSLTAGWLTSDVFSKTMGVMAGQVDKATGKTVAFTVAQLKAKGYTEAQAVSLNKLSQAAIDSATQIRTYTQMTDALKEEVGTAWSTVFKTLFGNVNGATKLFTGLHTVLENAFTKPIYALNNLLKGMKKLGGLEYVIQGIKNIFTSLHKVLVPVQQAFREIFPKKTAADLTAIAAKFLEFTAKLNNEGSGTLDKIKRTFAGVFAIFDILKQVFFAVAHAFGTLLGALGKNSGGFLEFTAHIGDMVVAFDKALKSGDGLTRFFDNIGRVLSVPLHLLGALGDVLMGLFVGFSGSGAAAVGLHGLTSVLTNLGSAGAYFNKAWIRLQIAFVKIKYQIKPFTDAVGNMFNGIKDALTQSLQGPGFGNVIKLLQTVLLGGVLFTLRKFVKGGLHIGVDLGGGVFGSIKKTFDTLTGTMKTMQTQIKANTLFKIAAAIALLTASVLVLSMIDEKKMYQALKGMSLGFAELLGAMAILTKISGNAGFLKIPLIAASMIALAAAILLLSIAVKKLSELDMESLKKGLIAVGALLAMVVAAAIALSFAPGSLSGAGLSMIGIAIALNLLAIAVKKFSEMSWQDIAKGMAAVGGGLAIIAGAMHLMPKGMLFTAAGLVAVSFALVTLAGAVKLFAMMDWGTIAHGLGGIAAAMIVIGLAMRAMPENMFVQAAGLVLVGMALNEIARAVIKMGSISWEELTRGLVGLGGSLVILAIALRVMSKSKGGAAALVGAAFGLGLLVNVVKAFAAMSWGDMIKGLLGIAATFGVIALGALLLQPVTPALLALGAALLLIGLGVGALTAGFGLLLQGLASLGSVGVQGLQVLGQAFDMLITKLPGFIQGLAEGLVQAVLTIGQHGPEMVQGLAGILQSLMQAIINILPKALELFGKLIGTFLTAITQNAPKIIQAGFDLLVDFLNGIAKNAPKVVDAGADAIVAFINGVANNIGRIIDAGFNLLVKFLNGIADAIEKYHKKVEDAGGRIARALIQGIWDGIKGLAGWLWDKVTGFLSDLWGGITDFLGIGGPSRLAATAGAGIVQGLALGIDNNATQANRSAVDMSKGVIDAMGNTLKRLPNPLDNIVDTNPTITPVLDLTNVQKDASKLNSALTVDPVSADVSYNSASAISADQAAQEAQNGSDSSQNSGPKDVTLIQNNYSPKALSASDIYRQTRNQISQAKEVLAP